MADFKGAAIGVEEGARCAEIENRAHVSDTIGLRAIEHPRNGEGSVEPIIIDKVEVIAFLAPACLDAALHREFAAAHGEAARHVQFDGIFLVLAVRDIGIFDAVKAVARHVVEQGRAIGDGVKRAAFIAIVIIHGHAAVIAGAHADGVDVAVFQFRRLGKAGVPFDRPHAIVVLAAKRDGLDFLRLNPVLMVAADFDTGAAA